jgi:hypothetical protein
MSILLQNVHLGSRRRCNNLSGENLNMPGWGVLENNNQTRILHSVNVTSMSRSQCSNWLTNIHGSPIEVPAVFICTKTQPFALLRDVSMYYHQYSTPRQLFSV